MSNNTDLTKILQSAQSPDGQVRKQAEVWLQNLEKENFPNFLAGLCAELVNEDKPLDARQLAGLMVKNSITARNEAERNRLAERWLALPDQLKVSIRKMAIGGLASIRGPVRSTSALLIAKVASIELPRKLWPELVDGLVGNCTQKKNGPLREGSYECLGFICEECPDILEDKSPLILKAISEAMSPQEKNNAIKLSATTALANAMEFIRKNFEQTTDRNIIMTMVMQSATAEDPKVRIAAYQALVEIVTHYYPFMPPYIEAIFKLTSAALVKEDPGVQMQAVEFWTTMCEVEMEVQDELLEAQKTNQPPGRPFHKVAAQAAGQIAPLIINLLTNQSAELDDDTWTPATAAGVALTVFAQCVQDNVVPPVLKFVEENITGSKWQFKEAAVLAFGCILEGPTRDKLAPLVSRALPVILTHMKDSQPVVKDTAAWTVGRICNLLPEVVTQDVLRPLMDALRDGLREAPKIAANVAWAIHNLASMVEVDEDATDTPLSDYLEGLLKGLFNVLDRSDVHEGNLQNSAYEAINSLIHTAPQGKYDLIGQLLPVLMTRLGNTVKAQANISEPAEAENLIQVQALICGALQALIQKLEDKVIAPRADDLMTLFLNVLKFRHATLHEEALMAVGALASRSGAAFDKYMNAFKPFLLQGLRNTKDYQVCVMSVGCVGDIARSLEENLRPHCDDIMQILLSNLQNAKIERVIKPHIISTLGDIAMAVGGYYERYLPYVMGMLIQASQARPDKLANIDDIDWFTTLRESILEGYSGILQGLAGDHKADLFNPYLDNVVPFLKELAEDQNRDDVLTRAAAALIGDMAARLGNNVKQVLTLPFIVGIAKQALNSQEQATQESGEWAKKAIEKAMSGN